MSEAVVQKKAPQIQRCRGCGGVDFYDDDEGNQMCQCGLRIKEATFQDGPTFTDKRLDGQKYDFSGESRDRTKQARQYIKEIIQHLKINEQCPEYIELIGETPIRIMKLAYKTYFIDQGSNIQIYSACALYIALRFHKAPFLLMDFSDKLKINLFQLAKCYRNLAKFLNATLKLNEKLPSIDPSVYIPRFCRICDFGEDNEIATQVCETALKLMKRMKLDWMTHGRRPSSLFGCSIIIAARMHGFKRTTSEISQIVYVCQETLRKRLEEFKDTEAAQLTLEKFHQIEDVEKISQEMDPPAFSKQLKKQISKEAQKVREIQINFDTPLKIQQVETDQYINQIFDSPNIGEAQKIEQEMNELIQIYDEEEAQSQYPENNNVICDSHPGENKANKKTMLFSQKEEAQVSSKELNRKEEFLVKLDMRNAEIASIKDPIGKLNENEELSDFSDDEKTYFNTENFIALKSMMWHQYNETWIKDQTRQRDEIQNDQQEVRRRNKRRSDQLINDDNPIEAILKSQKGQKLDPMQLNEIFNEVKNTQLYHVFTNDNTQTLKTDVNFYNPIAKSKTEETGFSFGIVQKLNDDYEDSDYE